MIAEILKPFDSNALSRKIDYQIKKIESGVARELHNSVGDTIYNMFRNMSLVAELNERVKLPYGEFILSSPAGECLSDKLFIEIAQKYIKKMGYDEACYTIIKNEDKEHQHVHILTTTVDLNGLKISDSKNWERSNKIMRELEKEYGLQITEKGKSSHNKSLGESQYRQYFFDTALHKALRSRNAQERVKSVLEQSDTFKALNLDMKNAYTNTEWQIMLGEDVYEKMLEVLSKGKFFNPLLKDELLTVMDRLCHDCGDVKEFRDQLEKEGYYMRLVSDKGKSHYVYGIPDRGFYIKDSAVPEHYRFGKIQFVGSQMTADEQKHFLYNQIFAILHGASSYEDFKYQLADNNIKLIEHVNGKGIYGISFVLTNVDAPEIFKSSDISRRLTYQNIQNYFLKENAQTSDQRVGQERGAPIDPVIVCFANNRQEWERELSYMYPAMASAGMVIEAGSGKRRKEEDDLPSKKKKKKRKGLSL